MENKEQLTPGINNQSQESPAEKSLDSTETTNESQQLAADSSHEPTAKPDSESPRKPRSAKKSASQQASDDGTPPDHFAEKQPEAQTKTEAEAEVEANVEAKAEVEANVEAKAEVVNVDAEAEVEANVEAEAEVEANVDAEAEVEANVDAEAEVEANVEAEAKPEKEVDSRVEAVDDVGKAASEVEVEVEVESAPEVEAETEAENLTGAGEKAGKNATLNTDVEDKTDNEDEDEDDEEAEEELSERYGKFNREELVEVLEALVREEDINQIRPHIGYIKVAFRKLLKEEGEANYEKRLQKEDDHEEAAEEIVDPLSVRFDDALQVYREKKGIFDQALEQQKLANLELKEKILEDLRNLIESEEELKKPMIISVNFRSNGETSVLSARI
jgi:hypothetical protein